jgi:branched-chain amino acid transport system permease protein
LLFASPYIQAVIATILIYTIAVSGLNLLGGYGGYPNLSQATFLGVSAYMSAYLSNETSWGFWPQLILTPVLAACIALIVAVPMLRLRGQYFAIATLLLGVAFTTTVQTFDTLGGTNGIAGFDRPFNDPNVWLIFVMSSAVAVTLVVGRLVTWPFGRHLRALRHDEALSESIGIPVYRRKLQAFVGGAYIGGLAGVLLAYNSYYISPSLFNFYESFLLFVALVIGGAGTMLGPILGSAFIVGLPEVFRFAAEARDVVIGVVFVLVLAAAPDGLSGGASRLARTILRAIRRRRSPVPPAHPNTQTEDQVRTPEVADA